MQKLLHVHTQITDCSSSIAQPYIQDANHRNIITNTCANNCSCHCIRKVTQCLSSLSNYFVFSPKDLIELVSNVIDHIADFSSFKYLSVYNKDLIAAFAFPIQITQVSLTIDSCFTDLKCNLNLLQ